MRDVRYVARSRRRDPEARLGHVSAHHDQPLEHALVGLVALDEAAVQALARGLRRVGADEAAHLVPAFEQANNDLAADEASRACDEDDHASRVRQPRPAHTRCRAKTPHVGVATHHLLSPK